MGEHVEGGASAGIQQGGRVHSIRIFVLLFTYHCVPHRFSGILEMHLALPASRWGVWEGQLSMAQDVQDQECPALSLASSTGHCVSQVPSFAKRQLSPLGTCARPGGCRPQGPEHFDAILHPDLRMP